jgi:3-oxoacyl-[acyl-carrier protein] reductase
MAERRHGATQESEFKLADGTGIATGAGSGIGQATVLLFAQAGTHMVVTDICQETGEATAMAIRECVGTALFVQTDVAQSADLGHMVERALDTFGRIDILVDCVGILRTGSVDEPSDED